MTDRITYLRRLYERLSDDDLRALWAMRNSSRRNTHSGGRNGGRPPICGDCMRQDCASCRRRHQVKVEGLRRDGSNAEARDYRV